MTSIKSLLMTAILMSATVLSSTPVMAKDFAVAFIHYRPYRIMNLPKKPVHHKKQIKANIVKGPIAAKLGDRVLFYSVTKDEYTLRALTKDGLVNEAEWVDTPSGTALCFTLKQPDTIFMATPKAVPNFVTLLEFTCPVKTQHK